MIRLMLLGATCGLMSGCSIGWGDFSANAFTQPATDVIQTRTFNAVGFHTVPEAGVLSIGWLRSQETSVPAFDEEAVLPDVTVSTDVNADSGIAIVDTLEIGVRVDEAEEESTIEKMMGVFE